jgi:hypothetical protein
MDDGDNDLVKTGELPFMTGDRDDSRLLGLPPIEGLA